MWMDKKRKLKSSYYRSFFALIVVPILLIIIISMLIIHAMMIDAATLQIKRAQSNIVSTLGLEVKDASLRLSHFVYVNDNEIMKIAAQTDTKDGEKKYRYTKALTESFNYAMVPVQDILSAEFYMKSGDHTYMKDEIILPKEQVESAVWYRDALADKNKVKIGFYDTNITYSRRNAHTLIITAALSPDTSVDRDGVIEMVALFATSKTGNLIKEYNQDKLLGSTMILDSDGIPVFDAENTKKLLPADTDLWNQPEFHGKVDGISYVYVTTTEPTTGLKIVSAVAANTLTRDFNGIAIAILGVTVLLFALFYFFSSYFLKNIIEPIHNTVEGMRLVEEGSLEVHIEPRGQAEMRIMIHSFNRMTRHLKQLIQDNEEQQKKKHEAEIRALQSQINPHFLVNSLNSIRFIAQVSKYEAIAKMAEALIKILSSSFRSNVGIYPLKDELEVLDGFVYLMQIRYSDGFEVEYHVKNSCLDCLVPRLILQPIVENSIVHGFDEKEDELGRILLSADVEAGYLYIRIEDNGKGMSEDEIEAILSGEKKESEDNVSIGITNVNTRLILNYGQDCQLKIESVRNAYTRTTIRIPEKRKE